MKLSFVDISYITRRYIYSSLCKIVQFFHGNVNIVMFDYYLSVDIKIFQLNCDVSEITIISLFLLFHFGQ